MYERLLKLEVPAAPVLSHEQVFDDPQIRHNGCVVEGEHPVYGRLRRARPSARFSATPTQTTSLPALYGEHTDEILKELGKSDAQREALRAKKVIPDE